MPQNPTVSTEPPTSTDSSRPTADSALTMSDESAPIPALPSNALVFMASGQGAQKPGMGLDLLDVPQVAAAFELASSVLGRDLTAIIANEDATELNDTRNAQFALAAMAIGIGRALQAHGVRADAYLGFSLGQLPAMALASMMDDEEAFRLISVRAQAMAEAAERHPGAMMALLKGDTATVEECVAAYDGEGTLVVANYNSPAQTVVSGSLDALEWIEERWRAQGGRAQKLATSGAFHSPLMTDATGPLAAHLSTIAFREPAAPLIANHSAAPLCAADAPQALVDHLTHPVRFEQSVRSLIAAGATDFVEVGFGGVLDRLIKRINPAVDHCCVDTKERYDAFLAGRASAPQAQTPQAQ